MIASSGSVGLTGVMASCLVAAAEVVVPSLALNSTVLEVAGSVLLPLR